MVISAHYFLSLMTYYCPLFFSLVNMNHSDLNRWISSQMKIQSVVKNLFDYPIQTFWIDETDDDGIPQGILKPGQTVTLSSFIGHVFYATKYDENVVANEQEIVDFMVVDGSRYDYSPKNRLESCEIVPGSALDISKKLEEDKHAIAKAISFANPNKLNCDDMKTRFVEFSHSVWHITRLALNYAQPQLVPPVTKEGFMHLQLPPHTKEWLTEWYDREKLKVRLFIVCK